MPRPEGDAPRLQHALAAGKGGDAGRVEDDVVGRAVPGEILLGVVDDPRGSERAHEIKIGRAANACHFCPKMLGDLDRRRPDIARSADDQDLVSAFDATLAL
jgi:hypothetical protein